MGERRNGLPFVLWPVAQEPRSSEPSTGAFNFCIDSLVAKTGRDRDADLTYLGLFGLCVFDRSARICCLIWHSLPYLKFSVCLFSTSGGAITFLKFLVVMTRRVS
jgi:hypothetical protein